MSTDTNLTEVGGVMWCVTHHGVVDECSTYIDEQGEPCCDNYDAANQDRSADPCDIRPLYYITQKEPTT